MERIKIVFPHDLKGRVVQGTDFADATEQLKQIMTKEGVWFCSCEDSESQTFVATITTKGRRTINVNY